MAYVPLIRLFLSSPGDVYEERAIVHEEIETLINRPAFREKVAFRVIAWDKKGAGTVMRFRMPPQEAINLGLPRPSECDIVVVIFWSRLGTSFTAADGQTYESGTHYELLDAINSPRPEVVIYRRVETPNFNPDAPDFDDKSDQYKRLKEFLRTAVFYDPQTGSPRGVSQHPTAEDFRVEFRTALEQLTLDFLARLGQDPVTVGPASPPTPEVPTLEQVTDIRAGHWPGSPFPGLRAFTAADAPIFFGRGREADAVVKRLAQRRFVVVVGASGSGKSSLAAAGVIPRLLNHNAIAAHETASEHWRVLRFTPASHDGAITASPLEALYYALLKAFPALVDHPLRAATIKREFLAELRVNPAALGETCAHLLADAPREAEILLFIDQFEELFTLVAEAERAPFVELLRAASEHPRLRVIATLRADFYAQCVEWPALAALLQTGSFPLSTPTGGALYEMVQFPADRAALRFADGLVAQILKDTGESAGALALLAYALDELYRRAEERADRTIHFDDYAALGGVEGAIGRRAEAVFAALGDGEADEGALKALFHRLVSVSEDGTPTRQRVPYAPGEADPPTARLVKALTDARLLVMDTALASGPSPTGRGEGSGITLEVAHEALFRSWPRLRAWIAEAQEDLILLRQARNAAADWATKWAREPEKDFDYLRWPHERLDLVVAMLSRLNPTFADAAERATFDAFIEPESARLLRQIDDLATDHKRRRWIGERLATIGDPRSGIGLDARGLPQIDWLPVSPGGEIEIERRKFTVRPFYVAKYLVTYAQFEAFLNAPDGFYDERAPWWNDFPGRYGYVRQAMSSAVAQYANYPRDSVSWYQAVAFSRWLDAKYRQYNLFAAFPQGDWQIRLPTEWEWGWMAKGGALARNYPWGNYPWGDWDAYPRANTTEAGIGDRSTAVGMYPDGAAACGALDVAGNLWEWCLNDYENPEVICMNKEKRKVLRGGSFDYDLNRAASSFRDYDRPHIGYYDYGFRLVACPVSAL
jgi:formylglycine-generating enzyme required for sulfatase activity